MIRTKVWFFRSSPMWHVVCEFSFCRSEGHVVHYHFWPNFNFSLEHQIKRILNTFDT